MSRIFLILGSLSLFIGMFVRMIFASWDVSSLFFVSSGIVCVAVAVILDIQGFYRMFQPRSVRRGLRAFGLFIVMVSGVMALNYFLADFPAKLDLSPGDRHTLNAFSKNIAKSFTDRVDVSYLQTPGPESHEADAMIVAAVKKYQDENPNIRFTKYNIAEHPELLEKFPMNESERGLFFSYKDRVERCYKPTEESMTKALLRLLKGRKTIFFSVGHGESKTDSEKPRDLKSLRQEIERLFYDVTEINLENEMLPKDAAGLAIIGPDRDISDKAGQKILEYLGNGGRVFLAFDPIQNPDNAGFLRHFGLKTAMGIVHQEENALANVGSFMVSGSFPNLGAHKILETMDNRTPVMFYVTNALLKIDPPANVSMDYKVSELIKSVPTSSLRAGYSKQDKILGKGAFTLFAVAKNSKGGEIFISGDSDIFGNQFLYQQGNPLFMFNLFSYLSTDEDMIKAAPELPKVSQDFYVTDTALKIYKGFFILGFPVLFFFMGGMVWARRRWM